MFLQVQLDDLLSNAIRFDIMTKKDLRINEDDTKTSLVLPFIAHLGYNIFSTVDLRCEYNADMKRQKDTKKVDRVDYALMHSGIPKVFIEVKSFGTDLKAHVGQLRQYFVADINVQVGILTNGDDFWFFGDYDNKNLMDEKPFHKLKLTDLKDEDRNFLSLFTKSKNAEM